MPKTTPEQDKVLVVEAFDTFLNKSDYAAAELYWSPDYIQLISRLVVKGCSTSSRASRPR